MKTLLLIRHAHAMDNEGGETDRERMLSQDGMRDASRLGRLLHEKNIHPDRIITSDATRARQTAELMADQLKIDLRYITEEEDLYESSVRLMLQVINALDDEFATVAIVSHNPSVSYLCEQLCGDAVSSFSTSTAAHLVFETNAWAEISGNTGRLEAIYHPSQGISE